MQQEKKIILLLVFPIFSTVFHSPTNLCINQWHTNGIVTDQRSESSSNVRQFHQQCLHNVIGRNDLLLPCPVYNVRRPHQWHPILGHRTFAVHFLENFLLTLGHQAGIDQMLQRRKSSFHSQRYSHQRHNVRQHGIAHNASSHQSSGFVL